MSVIRVRSNSTKVVSTLKTFGFPKDYSFFAVLIRFVIANATNRVEHTRRFSVEIHFSLGSLDGRISF